MVVVVVVVLVVLVVLVFVVFVMFVVVIIIVVIVIVVIVIVFVALDDEPMRLLFIAGHPIEDVMRQRTGRGWCVCRAGRATSRAVCYVASLTRLAKLVEIPDLRLSVVLLDTLLLRL